jgi:hypothetical protein
MSSTLVRALWVAVLLSGPGTHSLSAQSKVERNPQQTQDSKTDAPALTAANLSPNPVPEPPTLPNPPELPKRMFGMIPDFENTNDVPVNHHPLTTREKFILSLHQAFDISAHVGNAFQAALQQASNGQPQYGQGWNAYGKRFAANEGDQVTSSALIYGVLPTILHEDPRYFRQGKGSTFSRIWYAVNRTFVTRMDDGTSGFNNSEIFGQLISCGISTSYYPQKDRTVGRVFSNWGVNLGGNSAYNVLSEYYPDMKRALFQRHRRLVVQDSSAVLNSSDSGH